MAGILGLQIRRSKRLFVMAIVVVLLASVVLTASLSRVESAKTTRPNRYQANDANAPKEFQKDNHKFEEGVKFATSKVNTNDPKMTTRNQNKNEGKPALTRQTGQKWTDRGVHPGASIPETIVHFDLKGAPPLVSYYEQLFPLLRKAGATGVLLEYEDMFPYDGDLGILRSGYSYSKSDIAAILKAARDSSLKVIPLIQTFGHLEFLLKHEEFKALREVPRFPQSICPTNDRSVQVLHQILDQVVALHPDIDTFHMGADEAYQVAQDERCLTAVREKHGGSKMRHMLAHMTSVATYLKQKLKMKRVLVWNDMFEKADVQVLSDMNMAELVEPVVWGYAPDVQKNGYLPAGMFERYSQVFPKLWLGSAFKGANGAMQTFIDIEKYLRNHESWLRLLWDQRQWTEGRFAGIIVTGWQRFDHFGSLCELLPVGIPSLITDLTYLKLFQDLAAKYAPKNYGDEKHLYYNQNRKFRPFKMARITSSHLYDSAAAQLKCDPTSVPVSDNWETYEQFQSSSFEDFADKPELRFLGCTFPGSKIFDLVAQLKIYRDFFNKVFETSQVSSWLADQQLRNGYGQVTFAEQALNQTKALRSDLIKIGTELKVQLTEIFYEETVNEWLDANVQRYLDKIKILADGCSKIIAAGSFQNRPLKPAKIEF